MTVQSVSFVDTSILCNLLPVPGRDVNRDDALRQMRTKMALGETLILPVAAVVETGNFIAHVPNGQARRETAQKFRDMLELVMANEAPWQLHQFTWGDDFLRELITGAGTGITLVDHAMRKVGCGDLCILAERKLYASSTGLSDVSIWTMDAFLAGHA